MKRPILTMRRRMLQRTLSKISFDQDYNMCNCRRTLRLSTLSSSSFRPILGSNSANHSHNGLQQLPWSRTLLEVRRYFESESAYHRIADETLEDIQDAVETALEEHLPTIEYEVVLANGVLTMMLPPHGTWVLNKQTPNRQIWWSSPLSGPRRYEYENDDWVFTRDESHAMTLKQTMAQEFAEAYGIELDLV
jgi:frataxin